MDFHLVLVEHLPCVNFDRRLTAKELATGNTQHSRREHYNGTSGGEGDGREFN